MENEKERYLDFEKKIEKLDNDISLLQKEEEEKQISNLLEIRKRTRERWELLEKIYSELTPWQIVQVARHPARPQPQDFVFSERFPWKIAEEFIELHGDRKFGDDLAIFAGFAKIAREKVMIIGHRKGHDIEERKKFNFGCAHPEGYRKALRAMKLAEKYHLPVVSLIDTPGAYPGIGSEERGIAQAIADNLQKMSQLKTQIIVVIIGEGGSAGVIGKAFPIPYNKPALAVAHALAAQYFGMRFIYLEAGSGASQPVPTEMIKMVRETIDATLIVGGGIRTRNQAEGAVRAGADIVVTGTVVENNRREEVKSKLMEIIEGVRVGAKNKFRRLSVS